MSDYRRIFAQEHPCFITIITEKKRPILIDNITILRQAFANSKQYFDYQIDAICILPEHLHLIIYPSNEHDYPHITPRAP